MQAVRSGPRALDFFSEPLVLDYLNTKFSRTLPDWDTQKPFKRNINQAFYRYRQQARKPLTDTSQQDPGRFQLLLLWVTSRVVVSLLVLSSNVAKCTRDRSY